MKQILATFSVFYHKFFSFFTAHNPQQIFSQFTAITVFFSQPQQFFFRRHNLTKHTLNLGRNWGTKLDLGKKKVQRTRSTNYNLAR